jgi:hypothetical protein
MGLPQFWDATAVVAVVANPAMFSAARTIISMSMAALETLFVLQPFDVRISAHDMYGNKITTSGLPQFKGCLRWPTGTELFEREYDVLLGYVVRDVAASQNGSHSFVAVVDALGYETLLNSPLIVDVAPLQCNPPETYANGNGSMCLFAFCDRGSGLFADHSGCQLCERGHFSDNGFGYGEHCQTCGMGEFAELEGSTTCQICVAPSIVGNNFQTCRACYAGQGPNAKRSGCVSCSGTRYSTKGECVPSAPVPGPHYGLFIPYSLSRGGTLPGGRRGSISPYMPA